MGKAALVPKALEGIRLDDRRPVMASAWSNYAPFASCSCEP